MSTGRVIGLVILIAGLLVLVFAGMETGKDIAYRDRYHPALGYMGQARGKVNSITIFLYIVGIVSVVTGSIIMVKTKNREKE